MLDESYFNELGQPSAARRSGLPVWAQWWIKSMRDDVQYWHAIREGLSTDFLRTRGQDHDDKLSTLPVWAQEWINTLKFEVTWWRELERNGRTPAVAGQAKRLF